MYGISGEIDRRGAFFCLLIQCGLGCDIVGNVGYVYPESPPVFALLYAYCVIEVLCPLWVTRVRGECPEVYVSFLRGVYLITEAVGYFFDLFYGFVGELIAYAVFFEYLV